MAVASIWWRAWKRLRSRGSSEDQADGRGGRLRPTGGKDNADGGGGRLRPTGGENVADGGGGWLRPTSGYITGSGTTYTASTTTATTFDSVGEPRPRDFHASMAPPTAPVVEENVEEELDVDKELDEDRVEKLEHLKSLVVQFRGDNRSAMERWLLEVDVPWVVHLSPGTHESSGSGSVFASHGFEFLVQSWILALRKIGGSIRTSFHGCCHQSRQDQDEGTSKQPSASEIAQLVQATVLKMLPFVGIAAEKTTNWPCEVAYKFQLLIDMHDTLSMASHVLVSLSCYVQEECSDDKMRELLSAHMTKLDDAIWDTVVEMRNNIMAWRWTHDGGSSDIHKVTHSIVSYTKVLSANSMLVNQILHDTVLRGEFLLENKNLNHVTNLIIQMVSSLERQPSTNSSLVDESLRFLFLINNFHYLLQEFHTIHCLGFSMASFTYDISYYINRYLHVSWEPVLKCLQDPATPRCFTTYSSPMPKFESEFQKTYSTQKLWKVPDPEMRKRLRKAIIDKVIPVFTQFLEDNQIATPPGFTPMEVEKMLGELFEG